MSWLGRGVEEFNYGFWGEDSSTEAALGTAERRWRGGVIHRIRQSYYRIFNYRLIF
jgi:hypothetical protein